MTQDGSETAAVMQPNHSNYHLYLLQTPTVESAIGQQRNDTATVPP